MARRYSGGGWIRPEKRWAIYLRDGLTCGLCGDPVERIASSGRFLTLDHVLPRCLGGSNHETNLRTLCDRCNRIRRAHPDPWRGLTPEQVGAAIGRMAVDLAPLRDQARELLAGRAPWWVWKTRGNVWTHFAQVARDQQEIDYACGQYEREEAAGEGHREGDPDEGLDVLVFDDTGVPVPF